MTILFDDPSLPPFLAKAYSQEVALIGAWHNSGTSLERVDVKSLLDLPTVRSFLQAGSFSLSQYISLDGKGQEYRLRPCIIGGLLI